MRGYHVYNIIMETTVAIPNFPIFAEGRIKDSVVSACYGSMVSLQDADTAIIFCIYGLELT